MLSECRPFVSVIVPTYKDWDRLQLCVDALLNQSYPVESYETILVNNDPADSFPPEIQNPRLTLVSEAESGSYAARNAGIAAAVGEIVAFTDADCIPDSRWIQSAVEYFEQNPQVEIIGGKIEVFPASETRPTLAELYDVAFSFPQERYIERVGYAVTANMIVRKSVFEKVGLFDPKLFSGGDMDWGMHAKESGVATHYVDHAIVNHPARRKIREHIQKRRRVRGARVIGGHVSCARIWQNFGISLVPPVSRITKLTSQKKFSLTHLAGVFFLYYFLRWVGALEQVLVYYGKPPVRR